MSGGEEFSEGLEDLGLDFEDGVGFFASEV
jgi:hypothetical protein